jgi:hypothetical protein
MSEPKFSWELLAGRNHSINASDYQAGFKKLCRSPFVSTFAYITMDQFEPRAELFFKELAKAEILRDPKDKYSGNVKVMSQENYNKGWDLIQTKINIEKPDQMDIEFITKADFEKYVLVTKYHEQYRFKLLPIIYIESCMEMNFKWTWSNLQKYLNDKNRREKRTKDDGRESRDESEIEKDRKLEWIHLFSDDQLHESKTLLYKWFPWGSRIRRHDDLIIENVEAREEFGKILYEVAQQHGFEYDHDLDKREDIKRFLSYINGYMSKLCPQTFSVLKDIPYYWLLMSKQDLSTMAFCFEDQNIPDRFHGTSHLKEMMLKIFLNEINSDRHDHELTPQKKEAISEAIYADVEYQHLNLDNVFTNSNPYLVLYNTHPSLRKS